MIIDTHAHASDGGWPPGAQPGLSPEEMLEVMDEYGIQKVWLFTLTGLVRDFKENNDKLYAFAKKDAKRLIPFYTVNPIYPESAVQEIGRCVEFLGCRGIKLHPWLQAFSTSYKIVNDIVEACIKFDLPIVFHDGTPPYSGCLQIANLAELYPEAKIVLGHAGLFDLYRNAVAAAKRFKNVYLCICGPAVGDAKYILKEVDNDRIFYGSDFGSQSVNLLSDRLKVLEYAFSSEQQKKKVLFENAEAFIKS